MKWASGVPTWRVMAPPVDEDETPIGGALPVLVLFVGQRYSWVELDPLELEGFGEQALLDKMTLCEEQVEQPIPPVERRDNA